LRQRAFSRQSQNKNGIVCTWETPTRWALFWGKKKKKTQHLNCWRRASSLCSPAWDLRKRLACLTSNWPVMWHVTNISIALLLSVHKTYTWVLNQQAMGALCTVWAGSWLEPSKAIISITDSETHRWVSKDRVTSMQSAGEHRHPSFLLCSLLAPRGWAPQTDSALGAEGFQSQRRSWKKNGTSRSQVPSQRFEISLSTGQILNNTSVKRGPFLFLFFNLHITFHLLSNKPLIVWEGKIKFVLAK
jgi:hypothetical protein